MKRHQRAKFVSYQGRDLWCCDFSDFGQDAQGLIDEIRVSEDEIRQHPEDSLLVAIYMHKPALTPDMRAFLHTCARQPGNPIHKLAIIGLTEGQRLWFQFIHKINWPLNARFFSDYEQAKAWLVRERF